jgi:hypothetical protein
MSVDAARVDARATRVAVQVPDLAIVTCGVSIEAAKRAVSRCRKNKMFRGIWQIRSFGIYCLRTLRRRSKIYTLHSATA